MKLTFYEYHQRWRNFPGHGRALAFDMLPQRQQQECWAHLAEQCHVRIDDEHRYERVLNGYEEPRKRRTPSHGTPTSTSTGMGRVQFDHGDALRSIPAWLYFEALTGAEVSSTGRVRCPMPDHEDLHPSCKVYGTRWICFACGASGTIIDLAAALYGIDPTGSGYHEIRRRVLEDLGLREAV